jgi:hypothetical protein
MPYIKQAQRRVLDNEPVIDVASHITLDSITGEFNYVISTIANELVQTYGRSYKVMSAIRAAMEDASAEFYRRVMAPYEDEKIAENGDVYGA